ncbi:MAG TPA: hypothetical protein PLS28_01695, partial [Clostridiales bacterium]|nr:hypothetical protein [Clostridiales bacterium]
LKAYLDIRGDSAEDAAAPSVSETATCPATGLSSVPATAETSSEMTVRSFFALIKGLFSSFIMEKSSFRFNIQCG